uniref:Putative Na+/H+ antiporter, MnhG component n=1 Tax=uncultured bacterium Contigcl_6 TaxID=1393676 RepID=W0FKQ1_9BACT|nr:putative Na+/H+ antiporter, MnhG component [uncultured bacterium Contigcl_6]
MRTMLDWIRFALSAVLTVFGLFVLVTATLGLFRFRYVLNRIHATALADTLAVLTILAGLALAWGFTPVTLKLLAVVAFLWLTSPVASHLIGRLEVTVNDQLPQEMQVEDSRFVAIEKEAEQEVRR